MCVGYIYCRKWIEKEEKKLDKTQKAFILDDDDRKQ